MKFRTCFGPFHNEGQRKLCVGNSHNLSIMSRSNYRRKVKPEDIVKFYCDAEKDPDGLEKKYDNKTLG